MTAPRPSFLARLGLAFRAFLRALAGEPEPSALPPAPESAPPSRRALADADDLAQRPTEIAPAPVPRAPEGDLAAAHAAGALGLLALLQREGRLIDFLEQDVTTFSDEDVGVAARVVHEGCRRALRAHVTFAPIRPEEEGTRLTLEAAHDARAIKLTGAVGQPPHTGTLRHRGWRATRAELPRPVGGHDPRVVAPAELELE
ncbi:MAG: DUF2760 domain-containing protein [Polyangiaceae bacterium]|nr:DUF2760 domain-containing protein [Polyangiaceae bacterium]